MKEKVYFIPGTMCDIRLWDEVWSVLNITLGDKYQLVHLPIPEKSDIEEILIELCACISDSHINLVGFSLGGYLASAIYNFSPKIVKKIFIAGNIPRSLPKQELQTRQRIVHWVDKNGYSGLPTKRAVELLHSDNQCNKSIIAKMKAMDKALGEKVLLQQLTATTHREDLFMDIIKATIPVTFAYGIEDNLVNSELFDKIPCNNSLIQVVEIPNAGHMLPLEQPDVMAKELLLWLGR